MAFPTPKELLVRILLVAAVGLFVYFITDHINERKAAERRAAQLTPPAPTLPVSEPQTVPGFDAGDLVKPTNTRADSAVAAATKAMQEVKVSDNPIIEKQTEDDRIMLHFKDMSGNEQSVVDSVAGSVIDDYVSLRNVFVGDVNIVDSYRLVNPEEEKTYGMGDYEYILNTNGKCEIAEVSVNYHNNNEPRVLGYRRC